MLVYTSLPVPIVISVVYLSILTPHAPTCGLHANYVYVIFADGVGPTHLSKNGLRDKNSSDDIEQLFLSLLIMI